MENLTQKHKVVSEEEWIKARKAHLEREKELTHLRDQVSAERRALPWVKVEKEYVFEGSEGKKTLSELFGENSQLIVYHFMFGPGWHEGCDGCSFVCDHVDAARQHLEHHDVSFTAVSHAPYAEFVPYKERMGWGFNWLSSNGSDFNYDYGVSYKRENLDNGDVFYNFKMQKLNGEEQPGISVFYKDESGDIFHTYSSYERGLDLLIGAYNYLDLTPKGRNESSPMDWMKRHDQYEN